MLEAALVLGCVALVGCKRPLLARDGTLAFQSGEPGQGASVLTANGVEYRDTRDTVPPAPIARRNANEPWRAPVGFILTKDGRFTKASTPTTLSAHGLAITLRASDSRVPSWGGEVLVRIDLSAPGDESSARWGENVAIIVDGSGPDSPALVDAALAQLSARDRVTIVDSRSGRIVVPLMPASYRSMVVAAFKHYMSARVQAPRTMPAALEKAGALIASNDVTRRVLVLTEAAMTREDASAVEQLAQRGVQVGAVQTTGDNLEGRIDAVRTLIAASGTTKFKNVHLTFSGSPAPTHVLEASGGDARWAIDAGELALGDVRAGEARTEVLRVSVPAWVPGEPFKFTVFARVDDAEGRPQQELKTELSFVYDDDIERIAKSRHGDIIAYAAALASLRVLDAAFVGTPANNTGGIRRVATTQAQAMKRLAQDFQDPAMHEQAELLGALLAATSADAK